MKKINQKYIKIAFAFGIGYWIDKYELESGIKGYMHNIILPFIRIQFGFINVPQDYTNSNAIEFPEFTYSKQYIGVGDNRKQLHMIIYDRGNIVVGESYTNVINKLTNKIYNKN